MVQGQNWAYVDFSVTDPAGEWKKAVKCQHNSPEERALRGEMSIEEALAESLKSSESSKRERDEENDGDEDKEPVMKKKKSNSDGNEDLNEVIPPPTHCHEKFPTMLGMFVSLIVNNSD